MAYLSRTFIKTYNSTDKFITLVDTGGNKTNTINICKYDNIEVEGNIVYLSVDSRQQILLTFTTNYDALQAIELFQEAVEALQANCTLTPSPGSTPVVSAVTLTQYQGLVTLGTVVPFQWYDISDTSNAIGLGTLTYRVQALSVNDNEPKGIISGQNIGIKINTTLQTIQFYEDSTNKILLTNNSSFSGTGTNTNITADNHSQVISNNSSFITALSKSIANVTNCQRLIISDSNVILNDTTDSKFFDINDNLSSYSFSDITVDKTSSIGKEGEENINLTNNEIIYSYVRNNRFVLDVTLLTGNISKLLDNPITDANAKFYFQVIESGSDSGFSVNIKDKNGSSLLSLNSGYVGNVIIFRFNKGTGLFELEGFLSQITLNPEKVTTITVVTNSQTSFTLPRFVNNPSTSKLFIDGNFQKYGNTFDYTISGNVLTWNNRQFSLVTTDELILFYS